MCTITSQAGSWSPFNASFQPELPKHLIDSQKLIKELKLATIYYKDAEFNLQYQDMVSKFFDDDDSASETLSHCSSSETITSSVSEATNDTKSTSSSEKSDTLYKTEMCATFSTTGACPYNSKCRFAHGKQELRSVNRHPKFRSTICRNFAKTGSCNYGERCCFIHSTKE